MARTDIIVVPSEDGDIRPVQINTCSGHEGDSADDVEVLIADMDVTSDAWENAEVSAAASTGYAYVRLYGSYVGNNIRKRGIIYSRCENLVIGGDIEISENFPYVIEYHENCISDLALGNKYMQVNDLRVRNPDEQIVRFRPKIRVCNLPGVGVATGDVLCGEPGVMQAATRPAGYEIPLMSNTISGVSVPSGATGTTVGSLTTDQEGGMQAVVGNSYNQYFRSQRFHVPEEWQTMAFPFIVPQLPTDPVKLSVWFVPVTTAYSASTDGVMTGRIHAYQSPSRLIASWWRGPERCPRCSRR
jgi:hypothetical protein